jgi:hypothetical protein
VALLDYPTLNDVATDANLVSEASAVTVQDMTFGKQATFCLQLQLIGKSFSCNCCKTLLST